MNDSDAIAMVRWAESVVVHRRAHVRLVRAQMISGSMAVLCSIFVVLLAAAEEWANGLPWFLVMVISAAMTVVMGFRLGVHESDLDDSVRSLARAAAERE